jgi:ketosteroid isomerase-like protein
MVDRVAHIAAEAAEHLYTRWNEDGLSALTDSVHPDVELVCDALHPVQTALRGLAGWHEWVARWDGGYETMQITTDGVIPMGDDHALALISITATPRGGRPELHWAAAHLWSFRDGRIARWESHVDIAAARSTLL